MSVWKIIKIILPVAQKITADIKAAKELSSDGGKKITKAEVQEIIADNVVDLGEMIEEIIMESI